MYFSHIYLNVPFNYVFLSRLLYSAKGISATDILPVICLGSDVALNKSKFIIIIIIIIVPPQATNFYELMENEEIAIISSLDLLFCYLSKLYWVNKT